MCPIVDVVAAHVRGAAEVPAIAALTVAGNADALAVRHTAPTVAVEAEVKTKAKVKVKAKAIAVAVIAEAVSAIVKAETITAVVVVVKAEARQLALTSIEAPQCKITQMHLA